MPLIEGNRRNIIYESIIRKVDNSGGILYALNGTEDHLHLVATVLPTPAIACQYCQRAANLL